MAQFNLSKAKEQPKQLFGEQNRPIIRISSLDWKKRSLRDKIKQIENIRRIHGITPEWAADVYAEFDLINTFESVEEYEEYLATKGWR